MPAVKLSQIAQNQTDIAALVSGSTPASKANTLNTARSINGLSFNGSANINHYATCATAAATVAKVATLSGYSLQTGGRAMIKFNYNNTAAAPTMNINSTGAKLIKAFGTTASTVQWVAGDVVELIYDGTNYIMLPTMGMVKAIDDAVDTLSTSLNGLTTKVDNTNLYTLLATGTTMAQATVPNLNGFKEVQIELYDSGGMLLNISRIDVTRFKLLNSTPKQFCTFYIGNAASSYYVSDTSIYVGAATNYTAKLYGIK